MTTPATTTRPTGPTRNPASLRTAVWLIAAQAVAVGALTLYFCYEVATTPAQSLGNGIMITVYFAILAAALVFMAWGLHRRRRWARGPTIVLELMLLAIGYFMVKAGLPAAGVPVMLVGVACSGLLLTPATREALGIR